MVLVGGTSGKRLGQEGFVLEIGLDTSTPRTSCKQSEGSNEEGAASAEASILDFSL